MPARPAVPAYAGLRAPRIVTTFTPLPTRRPRPAAYQRRIISLFVRDQQRLMASMQPRLARAFDELGQRAAQAYQSLFPRPVRQIDPDDAPVVDQILATMNISDYTSTHTRPIYEEHYLRTLDATSNSIRLGIGMGVNLPDYVGRKVVAEGGRRLGLLDVQGQSRTALFHALSEGRSQGMAREQLARHIRGRINRGPWRSVQTRAMVIARTETAHAQRISALETYSSMDVVSGMLAFDALGATTDADCEQRNGLVYSRQDADIETSLEHPNGTLNWAPHIDRQALAQRRRAARPTAPRTRAPRIPRAQAQQPTHGYDAMHRNRIDLDDYASSRRLHAADPDYIDVAQLGDEASGYFGGYYNELNRAMRSGQRLSPQMQGMADDLQRAYSPASVDKVTYRGVSKFDGDLVPGAEFIAAEPISTSYSARTSLGFARGQNPVMFQMRIKRGTRSLVTNAAEQEVLLAPGSKWKVIRTKRVPFYGNDPITGRKVRQGYQQLVEVEVT